MIHASSTHIIDCSARTRCAESVAITNSCFYGNEEPMDKCRPAGNTEKCESLFCLVCKLCFLFLSLHLLPIRRDTLEIVMCISCRSFSPSTLLESAEQWVPSSYPSVAPSLESLLLVWMTDYSHCHSKAGCVSVPASHSGWNFLG